MPSIAHTEKKAKQIDFWLIELLTGYQLHTQHSSQKRARLLGSHSQGLRPHPGQSRGHAHRFAITEPGSGSPYQPFVLAGAGATREDAETTTSALRDVGLDVKYGVSSSLNLNELPSVAVEHVDRA